ncbi:MAG: PEP-CTERM sorting domain-containing protein [Microcystis aeruginosa G13-09]|nr:PEP-CTERM sorting domain-containing protein [Microcystis aeruginosa G13-09]
MPRRCENRYITAKITKEIKGTPEPTSIISLFALGTLGAASTLKRKLKPSKSAEKETTKVG